VVEVLHNAAAVAVAGTVGALATVPGDIPVRAGAVVTSACIVLVGGVTGRYIRRIRSGQQLHLGLPAARLLVFGAGEGGTQIVADALAKESDVVPVAVLDDDPRMHGTRILGIPVVGGRDRIAAAARTFRARDLLVALPSASRELVTEITDLAHAAGLFVRVLPPEAELETGDVTTDDIRPLSPVDLLGRREIETDVASIAGYLTGRRVLVTGAGGSIGSELCRQLRMFEPGRLVLLDRDESALHAVELSMTGKALFDTGDVVLADIRDADALNDVFEDIRPDVVFHAAALKHLAILEQFPAEAVKTNVVGTRNVLDAAIRANVDRLVNISTDKAADPSSALGYSKRLAERLTAQYAVERRRAYLSVRFGNVLGSRGSMLDAFQAQIAAGGPITVTDPAVTRFFMTVGEAVQLVIQAGAIGSGGEALVLDMGEPVRIADVAQRLASQHGMPVDIVYTGLRPGEKLHEVLWGEGEVDRRPVHPLISHVPVPPLRPDELATLVAAGDSDDVMELFRRLCQRGDESLAQEGR
jgi:FlaA1/EpsC-like NDP-sugar epimerase